MFPATHAPPVKSYCRIWSDPLGQTPIGTAERLLVWGAVVASKLLSEAFGDWISVFPATPAGAIEEAA